MCGLAGFIGESTNPELSFQLITKLFEKLEVRGKDASGFWGTQRDSGKVLYHKEPVKSSLFISGSTWSSVKELNPNVLIVHAREASYGSGLPMINKNNHPFVNADLSTALIHNGRIPEYIYDELRKKYEVRSSCDSEMLLRIFEGADDAADIEIEVDEEMSSKLVGLRDIWATVSKGQMAACIGEKLPDEKRRIWLFRNRHRPLWLFDMRQFLGQVFFVSTPQLWQTAVNECKEIAALLHRGNIKFVELPTEEIWMLEIDKDNPSVADIQKFEVKATGEYQPWEYTGDKIKAEPPKLDDHVYTLLNDEDEPQRKTTPSPYGDYFQDDEYEPGASSVFVEAKALYQLCADIHRTVTDIEALIGKTPIMQQQFLASDLTFASARLTNTLRTMGG